jgi:hypothetical protein
MNSAFVSLGCFSGNGMLFIYKTAKRFLLPQIVGASLTNGLPEKIKNDVRLTT